MILNSSIKYRHQRLYVSSVELRKKGKDKLKIEIEAALGWNWNQVWIDATEAELIQSIHPHSLIPAIQSTQLNVFNWFYFIAELIELADWMDWLIEAEGSRNGMELIIWD